MKKDRTDFGAAISSATHSLCGTNRRIGVRRRACHNQSARAGGGSRAYLTEAHRFGGAYRGASPEPYNGSSFGLLAQIVLFALCPDKLVGIANAWDKTAEQYPATEYNNLP